MILERLKSETLEIHKEVEKDNLAGLIMSGCITQPQYETLLRQNFKVYKAVEDFINGNYDVLPPILTPFAGYDKTNLLAKDISQFSNLPLPRPYTIASPRDVATLVGIMYVVEGSMVGGMMMAKKIQSCEQLAHIDEHHFFSSNVKQSASRWKDFKTAVSSFNFTKNEIDTAIESATEVFKLFQESYRTQTV